jgi:hypothetical protein
MLCINLIPELNKNKIITLKSLYLMIFVFVSTAINAYSFDWYTEYIEMPEHNYGNKILFLIVSTVIYVVLDYLLKLSSLYKKLLTY